MSEPEPDPAVGDFVDQLVSHVIDTAGAEDVFAIADLRARTFEIIGRVPE